jgi:hypothetical protein
VLISPSLYTNFLPFLGIGWVPPHVYRSQILGRLDGEILLSSTQSAIIRMSKPPCALANSDLCVRGSGERGGDAHEHAAISLEAAVAVGLHVLFDFAVVGVATLLKPIRSLP